MPLPAPISTALLNILDALLNLQTSSAPKRYYSALFQDLPDRKAYADYYVVIKEVRCLNGILDSLRKSIYSSPQAVAYDLFLVWSNAREYNQIGSMVYMDADKLESHMKKLWNTHTPPLPPFSSLPRPGTLDPTPAPSTSSSKRIKLTLSQAPTPPPLPAAHTGPVVQRVSVKPRAEAQIPLPPMPVTNATTAHVAPITLRLGGNKILAGSSSSAAGYPSSSSAGQPSSTSTSAPLPAIIPSVTPLPPATSSLPPPPATTTASTPLPSSFSSASDAQPMLAPGLVPYESRKIKRAREKAAKLEAKERLRAEREHAEGSAVGEKIVWGGEKDVYAGWWDYGSDGRDHSADMKAVVKQLRERKEISGRVLATPIVALPDPSERSDFYKLVKNPTCLNEIEAKIENGSYASTMDFDRELWHLFESTKAYYKPDADGRGRGEKSVYGDLIVLQRLYQELTKNPPVHHTSASHADPISSLSSVAAGPGNSNLIRKRGPSVDLEPVAPATIGAVKAQPSARVTSKDKVFLDGINFKGELLRVGDWVHLLNPDNPAKPIIAQIFKVYKRSDSPQRCISVCWYYRPEETVHPASRQFYENEVFKTSNFIDHSVEDFIERCFVMFFTRYVRGRPASNVWEPPVPLYVCEHRYKDEAKSFKKIKNWNSCLPEEVRRNEYELHTFPGERVEVLKRIKSPFMRGLSGPGGIGGSRDDEEEDQAKYHADTPGERRREGGINGGTGAIHNGTGSFAGRVTSNGNPMVRGMWAPERPALVVRGITPAEEAFKKERFDALPEVIQQRLFSTSTGLSGLEEEKEIVWFPAPAIDTPRENKRPRHSLAYLVWRAEQLEKREGKGDVEMRDGTARGVVV